MKKQRNNISKQLKLATWETYLGIGVQSAPCPICGLNILYKSLATGFETAHIVASTFVSTEDNSVLYLYPCCSPCNNECRTLCLLDYMYGRGRLKQLREMLASLYKAFTDLHHYDLAQHDHMMWKVVRYLYGPERFKAGGGLENTRQIYELCRMIQYQQLLDEARDLGEKMEMNSRNIKELMMCEIKPMQIE